MQAMSSGRSVSALAKALMVCMTLGLASACSDPGPRAASLPEVSVDQAASFRWDPGGAGPVVEAFINGASVGLVLLDTALAHSILSPLVVQEQGLPLIKGPGREAVSQGSTTRCALVFADASVRDWSPQVLALSTEGIVGRIGLDVLQQLEFALDPFVQELRILPAGGLTHAMAAFAAEGWQIEALALERFGDVLALRASPARTGDPGLAPLSQGSTILVSTAQRKAVLPAEFLAKAAAQHGTSDSPLAGLMVGNSLLHASAEEAQVGALGCLGLDFLAGYLVGWDGPQRVLYLATARTLAHNR